MGIIRKVKDAVEGVRETVRALDETMPQLPKEQKPAPKKKPGDARFVTGLGQRIGFAGIALATVGAALVGGLAASCDPTPTRPAPTTAATCEEDQPWCWDCSTMGNRRCGPDDGAVKR